MKARSVAENLFARSGALSVVRFSNRHRLRALMYHRFPGTESDIRTTLSAQCDHLRRNYHLVSAAEVADALSGARPLPPNSLTVTVDDGYRDFQAAWDVFRSYGVKVTLFVVSRFVNRELWLWPDQIKSLFQTSPLESVEVPLPDGTVFRAALSEAYAQALADALVSVSNADRIRVLEDLPGRLRTNLPASIPERFAALSWDELRRMSNEGLEVGAHTQTHPVLSRLATTEEVNREIAGSRAEIESRLQRSVAHFCYPNGKRADYDDRAVAAVKSAGYRTAFNAESGMNGPVADPLQLSRIGVDPDFALAYFERCVAGYRIPKTGSA